MIDGKLLEMGSLSNYDMLEYHVAKHDFGHAFTQATMGQIGIFEVSFATSLQRLSARRAQVVHDDLAEF